MLLHDNFKFKIRFVYFIYDNDPFTWRMVIVIMIMTADFMNLPIISIAVMMLRKSN